MMHEYDCQAEFAALRGKHFTYSVLIDLLGMASFLLPGIGEGFDLVFAPISGLAIYSMYKRNKLTGIAGGIAGTVEELLPFTDIIPTATILYFYTYKLNKKSSMRAFVAEKEEERRLLSNR